MPWKTTWINHTEPLILALLNPILKNRQRPRSWIVSTRTGQVEHLRCQQSESDKRAEKSIIIDGEWMPPPILC